MMGKRRPMSRTALLLALAATAAPLPAATDGAAPPPAVAIACRVEGAAARRPAPEPLALCRRLLPGARLTVAPRSRVTVVFFDGRRYALEAEARALVEADGLRVEAGRARRLAPVPGVVDLAPILRDGAPRSRAAAVRIRGEAGAAALRGLEPREGAAVLRGAAVLSFAPSPGIESYRVTVDAEDGSAVFASDVRLPPLRVPAGVLRPAAVYTWRVEPKVPPRPAMRAEAVFVTLTAEVERARAALAAASAGQPDLALLLAEVDRCLDLRPPRP